MQIKITSWNINSVRIRIPLIKQLTQEVAPDILCLQETKVEDDKFPVDELKALGFEHQVFAGQKSYNGVAILSKLPLKNSEAKDFIATGEKRHISAELESGHAIHNFYIPAGGDIPDIKENSKFKDKLQFVDNLASWSSEPSVKQEKTIIVGDFNIAPHPNDVWSHKQLLKVVSHTPIEVEKLTAAKNAGEWIDTARHFTTDDEKSYSWWSYRNRDWKKSNRGRRLDHIWASPALKDALLNYSVLPDARSWERPSDHAPISLLLNIS